MKQLVRLTDRIGEALATAYHDAKIDQQHVDNLNEINLAAWGLRWSFGIGGGDEVPEAETESETAE